jgi:DNA-binding response OmpR family regulator
MDDNEKSYRILFVDDEPSITQTFELGLKQFGFKVDTFNNPISALASYRPGIYDLLLFDIRMPIMNGFELYRD